MEQLTDEQFVSNVYNLFLGRDPDPAGLTGTLYKLSNGVPRIDILEQVIRSDEFCARFSKFRNTAPPLPNLVAERPERYYRSGAFLVFNAASPDDLEWLGSAISKHKFYERPGPWGYGIDLDKAVLASFIASLGLGDVFEIGCGDGGLIACASMLGLNISGLDISEYAKSLSRADIKNKILVGDLLEIDIANRFELICAFDLLEHLMPDRLNATLDKIKSLLVNDGVTIFNVPAFGDDRIFSLVHTYWLEQWRDERKRGELWYDIPCDLSGFPLMGHLIWADTVWWEALFARHALKRLDAVERRLHAKFDSIMEYSLARRSYFVLGAEDTDGRIDNICAAIDRFDLANAIAVCHDLIET